jgi:hypothetical protein
LRNQFFIEQILRRWKTLKFQLWCWRIFPWNDQMHFSVLFSLGGQIFYQHQWIFNEGSMIEEMVITEDVITREDRDWHTG